MAINIVLYQLEQTIRQFKRYKQLMAQYEEESLQTVDNAYYRSCLKNACKCALVCTQYMQAINKIVDQYTK